MLAAVAFAVTTSFQSSGSPLQREFAVELDASDPVIAPRGASEGVQLEIAIAGSAHVWITSDVALRTVLRIEDRSGATIAEVADQGEHAAPYAEIPVEPGMRLSVRAVGAEAGLFGRATIHVSFAAEDDATRSAAAAASAARREAEEARASGEVAAARAQTREIVDKLLAIRGGEHSGAVVLQLWNMGVLADEMEDDFIARDAWQRVEEHRGRTLPPDDRQLAATRMNLARVTVNAGHSAAALPLGERALASLERTCTDADSLVQRARLTLAAICSEQGDLIRARGLQEQAVAGFAAHREANDKALLSARGNLANTLKKMGDLARASEIEEEVLERREASLPEDDPDLTAARGNFAVTLWELGELEAARSMEEKVLASRERTLPADHRDTLLSRANLALTLHDLGDVDAAIALQEGIVAAYGRTLPDDHPATQKSWNNMAIFLRTRAEHARARDLLEKVLAVRERVLPSGHQDIATARQNLGLTLRDLGELARARSELESAVDSLQRSLPAGHPNLLRARGNLADVLRRLGDLDSARELGDAVRIGMKRALPTDHSHLARANRDYAEVLALIGARDSRAGDEVLRAEFLRAARDHAVSVRAAAEAALVDTSPREAEARVVARQVDLDALLGEALGYGVFDPDPALEREAFEIGEMCRSAAISAARVVHRSGRDPELALLRKTLRDASAELARLAQSGASDADVDRARAKVDEAGRDVARRAKVGSPSESRFGFGVDELSRRFAPNEAAVCWRRYSRHSIRAGSTGIDAEDSLCAFVVRAAPSTGSSDPGSHASEIVRVELGPIAVIEDASRRWREAVLAGRDRGLDPEVSAPEMPVQELGAELRARILDPLAPHLVGAQRIITVVDDVLNAIALDALPAGGPWTAVDVDGVDGALLGDSISFASRSSILADEPRSPASGPARELLALGHPAFDSAGASKDAESVGSANAPTVQRAVVWNRKFATLPETRTEVRAIAAYFAEAFGDEASAVVLERTLASRPALIERAPRARWLHVATHGWFAPESVASVLDRPTPPSANGGRGTPPVESRARGMSPMLLSGLALAGANLPANPGGRIPGLVTAQEIATLDLSSCDLAVLSACDTNVGVRRTGQGVASLQRALHMAGARSVITSLWKVPDAATRELMVEFYRRVWVLKEPKATALWQAKRTLREARDDEGRLAYGVKDWGAWVLSGATD